MPQSQGYYFSILLYLCISILEFKSINISLTSVFLNNLCISILEFK